MLVLMSPTKTMKENRYKHKHLPMFVDEASTIMKHLQTLNEQDIKQLMKVNDKIAKQNYERFQEYAFSKEGSDALFAYEGLQYKQLELDIYDDKTWDFADQHVRILSGLYGVLKAKDPIRPYRLEMQCPLAINKDKSLYTLWSDKVSTYLLDEIKTHKIPYILNMTSKEYTKVLNQEVMNYLIDIVFYVEKNGKLKVEATQAKMARGQMLNYILKEQIETLDGVKSFNKNEFDYKEDLSNERQFVFVRKVY